MNSIRVTQYVTAFGPGSIFDFSGESLIAMDQSRWRDGLCRKINLSRLESRASAVCGHPVSHFLVPPVPSDSSRDQSAADFGLPYLRFPRWLFCARCRRLVHWMQEDEQEHQARIRADPSGGRAPSCASCPPNESAPLLPMRFVYVCPRGHIGDIDWSAWVHLRPDSHSPPGCQSDTTLRLESSAGAGGGLGSLWVKCSACKAARSLADLLRPGELSRSGTRCRGAQPWQQAGRCDEQPRAEQRGSSNVYFPRLLSAIDLPVDGSTPGGGPASGVGSRSDEAALAKLDDFRRRYWDVSPMLRPSRLRNWGDSIRELSVQLAVSEAEVIGHITSEHRPSPAQAPAAVRATSLADAEETLKSEEWPLLLEACEYDHFKTALHPSELAPEFGVEQVTEVRTLREVRAFSGFSRLSPSNTAVGSGGSAQRPWVPAIEIFGEGMFVPLSERILVSWERSNKAQLEHRLRKVVALRHQDGGLVGTLPVPTPRFVLLHSLSHALIRQLSFECGYDTASLRERIYCVAADAQGHGGRAGILIYTASSDSEGSLGGLARQALPDRFSNTFVTALKRASWCSSDPVCAETESQGLGGLNRAACHACMLVTETSCTCFNTMLDRSLLIGDGSAMHGGVVGMFHAAMKGVE